MFRIIKSSIVFIFIILFTLSLISCGGGNSQQEQESKPQAQTVSAQDTLAKGDPEQGKTYFIQFCSACHGQDALGLKGLGKDLVHSEFVKEETDEQLLKYVNEGRTVDDPRNTTGIPMPPKGGNPALTDQQIVHIIAYLRTIHVDTTQTKE
jgi:mono/diheme cytochrome c family protein